jgi:hypothetical protein
MVCAHCGSESHRTGSSNCPNYTYWWRRSCANRAGTVATVRIEITDVQTTNALTAASKGTSKDFARMCSVRIAYCDLFGHVNKKNCKHKHCVNVQVDWLTILLSVSASHTITELLKASDCTVDPNTLRSGGKFRKFADSCDSIGAEQLLELKHVTSDFQKNRIASYKNL